jgi:hypothetical protein
MLACILCYDSKPHVLFFLFCEEMNIVFIYCPSLREVSEWSIGRSLSLYVRLTLVLKACSVGVMSCDKDVHSSDVN